MRKFRVESQGSFQAPVYVAPILKPDCPQVSNGKMCPSIVSRIANWL